MKWMRTLFLSFIIFSHGSIEARLFLNVNIFNKKGIDLGLTLSSELHGIEEVHEGEKIVMKMKNGISIILFSFFEKAPYQYGPSHFVFVKGQILDENNEMLKDFMKKPMKVALGLQETIFHNRETQQIELKIMPEVR